MSYRPDDVTRQIVALFAAINRRYARESEQAAAEHELTPLQAKALLAAEEPVPMRRIAEYLHAEPSNVTTIIDRLEGRGLVERHPAPDDRRVKLVAATETGLRVAADLRTRMPFASRPLHALDDRQREALRDLLQLVAGSESPN
ncbi:MULTISPECIES: MarR family winged helix-turn-helix transcriptional regulator [unclassified Streptomyces]|uniref:MarR family winged helix-turn-helix transcriptional regulator n=1 Tax=unclassified Streptomyces TaxID=2593676 RepID=UPI002E81AA33|nr:MarR family transcriptional regulator [Streptomyces sp. NBC_00589]WTI42280.1 MarR family transcriptional regulator [Streptomyces sp. NBC_00775]WUB24038.1 MarR family transcriptional regulator [Streptomyces sp. NBC_00589]